MQRGFDFRSLAIVVSNRCWIGRNCIFKIIFQQKLFSYLLLYLPRRMSSLFERWNLVARGHKDHNKAKIRSESEFHVACYTWKRPVINLPIEFRCNRVTRLNRASYSLRPDEVLILISLHFKWILLDPHKSIEREYILGIPRTINKAVKHPEGEVSS